MQQNFEQKNLSVEFNNFKIPKIGVIALSTDFTIEQDYNRICHNLNVDIFFNRIPFSNPLNNKNYIAMKQYLKDVAYNILPKQEIEVVAYGCTSGTIIIGEDEIFKEIRKAKPNAYVTTPITAAIKAYNKMKINKISILTPYPVNVNESIHRYLEKHNFEIVNFYSFNLESDFDIARVDKDFLYKTLLNINNDESESIFISCTALKALEIINYVEKDISKPVLSSNQAMIWDSLRSANINNSIIGYGKLLKDY